MLQRRDHPALECALTASRHSPLTLDCTAQRARKDLYSTKASRHLAQDRRCRIAASSPANRSMRQLPSSTRRWQSIQSIICSFINTGYGGSSRTMHGPREDGSPQCRCARTRIFPMNVRAIQDVIRWRERHAASHPVALTVRFATSLPTLAQADWTSCDKCPAPDHTDGTLATDNNIIEHAIPPPSNTRITGCLKEKAKSSGHCPTMRCGSWKGHKPFQAFRTGNTTPFAPAAEFDRQSGHIRH